MTHPLFGKEVFIETAFERRFQAMLRSALHKRTWHVIIANPGSGKTMGIRELVRTAGSPALLAVTAPKNDESEQALGNQLFIVLGLSLRGRWSERKPRLMGSMVQFGVKCLIVDDAHDLSLEHLMYIKELTDQGRLHYDYPFGLCLVTAGRGNTIPLKEILDQPDTMWLQFRRRLDKLEPFCRIAGHTSEEVREILATLETVYRELFPQLNLRGLVKSRLHLAHTANPRPHQLWAGDDGLPDEARDHRPRMVACCRGNGCEGRDASGSSFTPRAAP